MKTREIDIEFMKVIDKENQMFSIKNNKYTGHNIPINQIIILKNDLENVVEEYYPRSEKTPIQKAVVIKGPCTREYYVDLYRETNYVELYKPYLLWEKGHVFTLNSGRDWYIFISLETVNDRFFANYAKIDNDTFQITEGPFRKDIIFLKEAYLPDEMTPF